MSGLFHGLSAFPITPCTQDGTVIEADFERILKRIIGSGASSVGVLGSTGTYAYLERDERRRAIEIARAVLQDTTPIIAGVGHLRTDRAIALAQDAETAGAQGLLLAPVSYTPLHDDEFLSHVAAVAGATSLPICIYNNPGTTHFTVSDGLLCALSRIDGVKAIKHPGGPKEDVAARVQALDGHLPGDFAVGFSGDWFAKGSMLAGGKAWYSVIGGLFPRPAAALTQAAMSGDREQADEIDALFAPLWPLFKTVGSLRVVYPMAASLGLTQAQPPLPIQAHTGALDALVEPLEAFQSTGSL